MNSKRIKLNCNVCYLDNITLKCNECTFECCEDCIFTWSKTSFNCPQCKKYKTYDYDYDYNESETDSEIDSDYEEPIIMLYDVMIGNMFNYNEDFHNAFEFEVNEVEEVDEVEEVEEEVEEEYDEPDDPDESSDESLISQGA